MNNRHRSLIGLLVGWVVTAACLSAEAQGQAAPTVEEQNPAVLAILETNPSTPMEWTRAAKILTDLDRPDLAKGFLEKVLAAKLDQKRLAQLQTRFGSAMFVQMASRTELAPAGKQLADAVLKAAAAVNADPKRLAALVKKLQDPSPDARYLAMDGLRRARGAAVMPLVAVLADPKRASEHANVRAALMRLGSDAVGPLLGILDAPDPKLKVEAIRGLGSLKARQTAVFLLGPFAAKDGNPEVRTAAEAALLQMLGDTPPRRESARVLARRAKSYLAARETLAVDDEDRVDVWTWDAAKKQPVRKPTARDDANRLFAARLARDAHAIEPNDDEIRRLYLAALLERAAHENGLDKPLPAGPGTPAAKAADLDNEALEGLLAYSIDAGYTAAATVAARLLGHKKTAVELLYDRAQPAVLVKAVRHPDRRLRFAAVEAIMNLSPAKPFAGSSYVLEALAYFTATSGSRRALVADPVSEESLRVAGYLAAMGYEVDTANRGRGLIRLAIGSPDYELVRAAASLIDPTPDLILQQLRRDSRTAMLPVGLLARAEQRGRSDHMARDDPLAESFARPHTEEAVGAIVERLLALVGSKMVPYAERQRQAAQALAWLAELSASDQKIFDVRRVEDAVLAVQYVPKLGTSAAAVLGRLGTPKSQRALVDLASRWTQPLELRRAAAQALRESIFEHGVLLTTGQILLQYDRYNQSANLDPDTQRVLASILDSIETPSRTKAAGSEKGKPKK